MNNKHKKIIYPSFEQYLARQMRNKTFKGAYEKESQRLRIAYQMAKLRKQKKLSQKELARRLDTTQSVVARMEAGQQNFTTDTLQKIALAFRRNLKVEFVK